MVLVTMVTNTFNTQSESSVNTSPVNPTSIKPHHSFNLSSLFSYQFRLRVQTLIMKLSYIASLLLVAALAAVLAHRHAVEIRSPGRVFAHQGYDVRFNFGIRSLDRNVSMV